jgi:hypothetical protein
LFFHLLEDEKYFTFLIGKMSDCCDKFWIHDPCALLSSVNIFPLPSQSRSAKLNSLTRLSILIAIIMYFMEFKYWLVFLLFAMLAIIILNCATKPKDKHKSGDKGAEDKKEHFTIPPTYPHSDLTQTTVSPTFSEEWAIIPQTYNIYENSAEFLPQHEDPPPESYSYGQFLSPTNWVPMDEYGIQMNSKGQRSAREFALNAFNRRSIAYRNDMSRLYKKSLQRRYRQASSNTVSPYTSY